MKTRSLKATLGSPAVADLILVRSLARSLLIAAIVGALASSACATSNYEYRPGEYVPIRHGVSPDRRYAIAAHGSGYLGYDHFQLYLIDAKTHKPLAGLKEPKDPFVDTGPAAYYAQWAPDSKEVSVIFRAERHLAVRLRYRVTDGHIRRIEGRTRVYGLPRD